MAVDTKKIEHGIEAVQAEHPQLSQAPGKIEHEIEAVQAEHPQLSQAPGKLILASIGAVGLAQDAFEGLFKRAVERGELSRKEARRRMQELRAKRPDMSRRSMQKLSESVRETAELPSKADIQSLHDQIAELSAKVDRLSKEKQPASSKTAPGVQ